MPVAKEVITSTTTKLTIQADPSRISEIKNKVVRRLAARVKIAGFRPGKAPLSLVEQHIDSATLQSEFLDEAINALYVDTITSENLRPVATPNITIQKFVPFTTLEFTAEVEGVGTVTLPDYKKVRLAKKSVTISAQEVKNLLANLQARSAERVEVKRGAKAGDEVVIDFTGKDATSDTPVNGADGKDYPLIIGSDTFIPGFETNLIGLKASEAKSFTLTFPKDYGVSALRNRKVTFNVTVTKVHELVKPPIDDAFAAKVGPFKTVQELRDDIKKQLKMEKQAEADREYENALLEKVAAGTKVAVPETLIDEEVQRSEQQIRQNLAYRGQTWQEYLKELGQSEEDYRQSLRPAAELRVRAGLALTEIAEQEQLTVTADEVDQHIAALQEQYKDPAMQTELTKPANRRSIASRILSEKTVARLIHYATKV